MNQLKIFSPNSLDIKGTIVLNGSKSICNRALIIRALCEEDFEIKNLSNAVDTVSLDRLLKSDENVLDAGAAGTTYRFLTAYQATQSDREVVLTGSQRMKERPIKILVEALQKLGAKISYMENEGFPPLKIKGTKLLGGKLSIPADTSSQYISALLMVAPKLHNGLELHLEGEIVSRPYIQMTLDLMNYFGIEHIWKGNVIQVHAQKYTSKPFYAEADWSAASYYYSVAALSNSAEITLVGLQEKSLQGDAVVAQIFEKLGVFTTYFEESILLKKKNGFIAPKIITYDFIECPDLAQTVVAVCGAMGVKGDFSGLSTLKIKETDRIAALSKELAKLNITFKDLLGGKASLGGTEAVMKEVSIETYEDHRMAMALAPLSVFAKSMIIEEPEVVNKSYPKFWEDLKKLGFVIE